MGEQNEFGYDYLILAAGVWQSYFGHDEYASFAPGMKTLEDALRLRRRGFAGLFTDRARSPVACRVE